MAGQTLYLKKDDGSLNPVKSLYYTYDQYGNRTEIQTALGNYNPTAQKTLVGKRSYTALGYLLNATTLVDSPESQVNIKYNTVSGLPTELTDALGNKVITHYNNKIWPAKPSTVDYYGPRGKKDFSIDYTYNANGDLARMAKLKADGSLVDQTDYTYDPLTLRLIKTEVIGPNGEHRSLRTQTNNYFAPQANIYAADHHPVYEQIVAFMQPGKL